MLKNSVQWDGWYDGECVVVDDQHMDQQEETKGNVEHFIINIKIQM
jgi:hypothetical protein